MNRAILLGAIPFFLFATFTTSSAQTQVNRGLAEHAIVFGGFSSAGELLHVNYEIPFPGVVAFELYNDQGARVWHKQAPLEPGPNRFAMKQKAFQSDESYSFVLRYKLSEVSGAVPVP